MLKKSLLFFSMFMLSMACLMAKEGQMPWQGELGDSIEDVRALEDEAGATMGLTTVTGNEMMWGEREFKGMVGDLSYQFAPSSHVFPGAELIMYTVGKEHLRTLQRFAETLLGTPDEAVLVSGRNEIEGSFIKAWNRGGHRYMLIVSRTYGAHFMVRYPFATASTS